MIINVKSYADFKAIVGATPHVDGVFYNLSGTINGQSVLFAVWAVSKTTGVQVVTGTDPTSATILTDFPSAQAITSTLTFSDQSVF
jgi:hypothetical protein